MDERRAIKVLLRPQEIGAIRTDSRGDFGILICYDIEFPEVARVLAEAGAEILFVPSCTDGREGFCRVRYCAQARAIENQVYVSSRKHFRRRCPRSASGTVDSLLKCTVPEPIEADQIRSAALKWAAYNAKMGDLFMERDKYPVDSTEREAAAQAILALWVAEGSGYSTLLEVRQNWRLPDRWDMLGSGMRGRTFED